MCLIRGAELLAGVAARTEPTMRKWLGELAQVHPITRALSGTPPSTRQMVRTKGNPNNIRQTPHNAGVIGEPVGNGHRKI